MTDGARARHAGGGPFLSLMEVDGTPCVPVKTGVEERKDSFRAAPLVKVTPPIKARLKSNSVVQTRRLPWQPRRRHHKTRGNSWTASWPEPAGKSWPKIFVDQSACGGYIAGVTDTAPEVFMAIAVFCSGCQKSYRVKDELAGRRVKCPACSAAIQVPASQADALRPAAAASKETPRAEPLMLGRQQPATRRRLRLSSHRPLSRYGLLKRLARRQRQTPPPHPKHPRRQSLPRRPHRPRQPEYPRRRRRRKPLTVRWRRPMAKTGPC